jgi:RNA polymerase sigma-70 factor (ECF subfamily)
VDLNLPLIKKAQTGDPGALNRLFSGWYRPVYGIAYRYFADAEAAKEVCQQTFLIVQQKLRELKDPAGFRVWLYRIAVNLCHQEARRARTRRRNYEGYGHFKAGGSMPGPEELYYREERSQLVLAALQQLPPEQRTVIIMKEYEELKFREIADILDIPENTAKSRLYFGLKTLRNYFLNNDLKKEVYHE